MSTKELHTYTVRLVAPETELDPQFMQGMANRMAVSFYKYGPLAEAYPHAVNALGSMKQRLDLYLSTGNTEYLVDVANFAMIEHMYPTHANAYFMATDSDGSPGRMRADGTVDHDRNDR